MPGQTRYHAPSVSYPVGRCFLEGAFLLGMNLLLLVVVLATAASGADPREHGRAAWWLLAGLTGWLAVAAWATRHWRQSAQGLLLWQQGQWLWREQDQPPGPGQGDDRLLEGVALAWDGQAVLLLRMTAGAGGPSWLWLERWRDPPRWDDLRRAVWATGATPV